MAASLSRVVRYAFAAVALAGAYFCFVFARASYLFQQDTAASVPAAVRLAPYDGSYVARLAGWQPDKKIGLLHRAVELNPFDADSWIQLGLAAEMEQRDTAAAERYYLQASKVDRMFLPRWTLTNFYFRQERSSEFFLWAKASLQITPYPADPVFAQMWLMSQDPQRIAACVPDRPGILLQYASFLANAHQYEFVAPVVKRLTIATTGRNPVEYGRDDQIGPLEDRLLAAGDVEPALEIWKSLNQARWIALAAPTPAHPITNGDFRVPLFEHGFDWQFLNSSGLTVEQAPDQHSLRIAFSGDEAEHCVLLQEYVPLDPNRAYRLSWTAEASGLESPSGITWQVHPIGEEKQISLVAGDLLSGPEGTWDFQSPNGSKLSLLTLEYTRPAGQVRANGSVVLQQVSMQER